jgi:mannose-6-phosphate isomerase-like protein (cupin superfamily)
MHIPVGPVLGKVWGTTQSIFNFNNVDINRLLSTARGYCSEHYHNCKFSRLFVLRGKMRVTIFRDNNATDEIVLTAGMCTDVPPRVWHKFETLEDSDTIEIYWVVLDDGDIERRTTGGISSQTM